MQRDSNGYVLDNKKSCGRFDDDGNYNGMTSVIEDHLGWFSKDIFIIFTLLFRKSMSEVHREVQSKTLKITIIRFLAVMISAILFLNVLSL